MAEKIWLGGDGTGTQLTDFNRAANWSPAAVPVDGDNLVFDDRAGTDAAGLRYSCLSTLNQSAKNFTEIVIAASYSGGIGIGYGTPTAGESALECGCDRIVFRGTGTCHLTAKHATAYFDEVIVDSAGGLLEIGKASTGGQRCVSCVDIAGSVKFLDAIASHLAVPDLRAVKTLSSSAIVLVTGGGYDDITVDIFAGSVYIDSGFSTLVLVSGKFEWGNDGFDPGAVENGDSAVVYGGIFNWKLQSKLFGLIQWAGEVYAKGSQDKSLGDSGVNGGTIEVWGGTLDLASNVEGAMALNTDCEVVVETSQGSFKPPKEVNVTWS